MRWVARLVTLVVLLTLIFLAVRLLRGDGGDSGTQVGGGAPVLLSIRDGGSLKAVVLLDPAYHRPLVVGMPGSTLLEGPAGFAPLEQLLGADDRSGLFAAVASLLGVRPAAVADLIWSDVRRALTQAGDTAQRPQSLDGGVGGAETAAQAVAALAAAMTREKRKTVTAGMLADGEAGRLTLVALRGLGDRGRPVKLPGLLVAGSGYTYYEPDVVGVQVLTGRKVEQTLTVEVQNGSGELGAAEAVIAALAPRGYRLLPPRNADGFPDVAQTEILTRDESWTEAERIQAVLGVGRLVRQNDLPAQRVVIVLGKDLDPQRLGVATTSTTSR